MWRALKDIKCTSTVIYVGLNALSAVFFTKLSLSHYHQVDFLITTKITGIITQGAKDFGHVQFVGSYKVAFSNDGEKWLIYQDEKQQMDKVGHVL